MTEPVPQRGFLLSEPTPEPTLEALARLDTAELGLLGKGGLRVRVAHDALFGVRLQLFVPAKGELQNAYEALRDELAKSVDVQEKAHELSETDSMALSSALPWMLLYSASSPQATGEAETAPRQSGEWLLVGRDLDSETEAKLFEDLRFHATHTRVASAVDRRGGRVTLFHVRDDKRRRSSLRSLRASGGLDAVSVLAAFRVEEQAIYLPAEAAPTRQALAAFYSVALAVPSLLALGPKAAEAERLLAIVPSGEDGRSGAVYALDRLPFVEPTTVAPPAVGYASFEVHSLEASSEALGRLHREVSVRATGVGYRLELRRTRQMESSERETQRLAERIAELEHRLAYLESLRGPRPVLLRFTPRQLPALADALRSFAPRDLRESQILYGFQANGRDSAQHTDLWHYLFFDPSVAVATEHFPLWRWSDRDPETVRFRLDPFWAHLGRDANATDCLVFVPEGMTLFPVLHGWEPTEMDEYLRRAVHGWFPDDARSAELPQRPIYLFDAEPGSSGQLRLHVLDRDGFAPLSLKLGWLNDNLALHRALPDADALMSSMASEAARRELSAGLRSEADAAEQAFRAAAESANRSVASGAAELLTVMNRELAAIADKCREAEAAITAQHRELETIEEALGDVTTTRERVVRAADRTRDELTARQDEIEDLRAGVQRLQEKYERTRKYAEELETKIGGTFLR